MPICQNCGREVEPIKRMGLGWAILFFLLGLVPFLFYVINHLWIKKPTECPACGAKNIYFCKEALISPPVAAPGVFDLVLFGLATVGVVAALYLVFMWVPTADAPEGIAQRIFYFHVPMGWMGLAAMLVVFVGSILYLWRGEKKWDVLAYSGAEIGAVFTFLALVTGSIWAKPAWFYWWVWDPRLTSTLVLWLMFIAYLLLRAYAPAPQAPRYGAVVGIVGGLDVPIVYMSIRWWRTLHPGPVIGEGGGLHPTMLSTLLVSIGAFTLFFILLARLRVALKGSEGEIEEIKETLGR